MRGIVFLALCALACTASFARSFTVDDLLRIQGHGQVVLTPDGGLLLFERQRPYAEAADFGFDTYFNSRMLTRILAVPTAGRGAPAPLFPQSPQAGYWIGALSPGGKRLAVFRLEDRRLSLGIVDLASRAVRWVGSAPDLPYPAGAPMWIGDDRLVFVAMRRDRLPASLSAGTAGTRDVIDLWTRQGRGEATRTLVTTSTGALPDAGERRLVLISAIDGSERTLASGTIVDAAVGPGGRYVAIVTAGDPVPPPPGPINVGFDSRRHRLRMIAVATGRDVAFTTEVLRGVMSWSHNDRLLVVTRNGGSDWTRARWSTATPDGRMIALGAVDDHVAVDEVGAGRIAHGGWAETSPIARIGSGATMRWVRLLGERSQPLALSASARPVGGTPAIKWMLDGRTLFAIDAERTHIVSRNVEQAGPVLPDPHTTGFRRVRNPDTLPLVVTSSEDRRDVRPVRGPHLLPAIPVATETRVLAAQGDTVIASRSDRHAVTELIRIGRGRSPALIDRINAAFLSVDLPRVVDLGTRAPGGAILHDWLVLPKPSGAPPPLVVNPYPGLVFGAEPPRTTGISRYSVPDNALLLASAGYAVLMPSMPLDGTGNPAGQLLARIDAATDAAVASGLVDPKRIGIQGHSFGAYAALTVATRSSRYEAIVAANGPYDLTATHGTMPAADKLRLDSGIPAGSSIGWTEGGQGGVAGPPSRLATAYLAASPMTFLDRVQNPVLLIHGDLDPVDITQSERAFMELYRHGKDATLARYWGEGHANASPANIRDYWRLIVGFLDRHLKGLPAQAMSTNRARPRRRREG